MARVPSFDPSTLKALCRVLGDPIHGLADTELKYFLGVPEVDDPRPPVPLRWRRIFDALAYDQRTERSGKPVVALIKAVMNPERYQGRSVAECSEEFRLRYAWRLDGLNRALAPAGYVIAPEGQVVPSPDKPDRALSTGC
jgi:hypothetical protein